MFACFANTFFVGVLLVHEIYNALDGFAVQRYFYFLVVFDLFRLETIQIVVLALLCFSFMSVLPNRSSSVML